jgi:hypothetical protein
MPEDAAYNESAEYNEQRDEGDDVEAHSATRAYNESAAYAESAEYNEQRDEGDDVEAHSATHADAPDAMAQEEPPDVEGHANEYTEYTE